MRGEPHPKNPQNLNIIRSAMPIQEMSIPSANLFAQGSIRSYSSGFPVIPAFRSCPLFDHSGYSSVIQNTTSSKIKTTLDPHGCRFTLSRDLGAGCVSWRWCSTRVAWRSSPPESTSWTASRSPSAPSHTASSPASSR